LRGILKLEKKQATPYRVDELDGTRVAAAITEERCAIVALVIGRAAERTELCAAFLRIFERISQRLALPIALLGLLGYTGGANRTDKPRNAMAPPLGRGRHLHGSFPANSGAFMSNDQLITPARCAVRQD
jgi:hypothetical protein